MQNHRSTFISEMLEENVLQAVSDALEHFFEDHINDIWPAAFHERQSDPNHLTLEDVVIVALPLDRIGGSPGASGSGVFVVYYSDSRQGDNVCRLLASPPLVVKVGNHEKLCEEVAQRNLWPHLSLSDRNRFALPLDLFQCRRNRELGILLAPFSSGFEPKNGGERHNVKIRDLWQLISREDEIGNTNARDTTSWSRVVDKVRYALDTMDKAHRAGLQEYRRSEDSYFNQYEWYLRGTFSQPHSDTLNSRKLLEIFGQDDQIQIFGQSWPNPNKVIEFIIERNLTFDAAVGSVHGDLHPKNIVLDDQGVVQIIDFGWACENRHIVIDYILLDINIRSVTLPSQLSDESVLGLANYLPNRAHSELVPANLSHRAKLISDCIWKPLDEKGLVLDWIKEYVIPLFLVSYGLIVHLDSIRNQNAHKALVLTLSKEIFEYLENT